MHFLSMPLCRLKNERLSDLTMKFYQKLILICVVRYFDQILNRLPELAA